MEKNNLLIFKILQVVAWMIFIGLCIEAGALLVNFVYSLFRPEIAGNLYEKLDLSDLYHRSPEVYFTMYSFVILIAVQKSVLFYEVIQLVMKLDPGQPFSEFAALKIARISYQTFAIGIFSFLARQSAKYLSRHGYDVEGLNRFWVDSQAYILMAAVIFVIATIFRKGIEIQNENSLTV